MTTTKRLSITHAELKRRIAKAVLAESDIGYGGRQEYDLTINGRLFHVYDTHKDARHDAKLMRAAIYEALTRDDALTKEENQHE